MESNLLYSKSTDLRADFTQHTLTETSRIMFDQISEHHDPAKLTHKINYHNGFTSFHFMCLFHFCFQVWFNSIHQMFHLHNSFSRLQFNKGNYKDLIVKQTVYGLFISSFNKYLSSTNFVKASWCGLILERNSHQAFFFFIEV